MVDLVHPSPSSPVPWCTECIGRSLGGDEHRAAPFPSRGGTLAGDELVLAGAMAVLQTDYQGLHHRRMHSGGDKVSVAAGRGLG
jgi:hypothetical protein